MTPTDPPSPPKVEFSTFFEPFLSDLIGQHSFLQSEGKSLPSVHADEWWLM